MSGGQTGVDRAALDAARELGLPYGGYVPLGRWTEEGPLPDDYEGMIETRARKPAGRTKRNVESADATLIFTRGDCEGGTLLTLETVKKLGKPHLVIDLSQPRDHTAKLVDWMRAIGPNSLNVAGPRASKDPAIYADSKAILTDSLRRVQAAG